MPGRLVVGRVLRPHGAGGEVLVEVLSDAPERFAPGSRLGAGDPDHAARALTVAAARPHQGRLLVRFEEIGDRDAVDALRGAALTIAEDEARALPEGSFYPHQLEGLDVVDEDGRALGTLVRVDPGPAHDHWVVSDGRREVLVPAVADIVRAVDLGARRIVLHPPDGLF